MGDVGGIGWEERDAIVDPAVLRKEADEALGVAALVLEQYGRAWLTEKGGMVVSFLFRFTLTLSFFTV